MRTDFFRNKKLIKRTVCALAVTFTFGCVAYAEFLTNAQTVSADKNFYFLVSTSTHVEASTQTAIHNGGAGYSLALNEREYVALSAYSQQSDGEQARVVMTGKGENTELLTLGLGKLYFKTSKEKKNASKIVGGLESLYGCIKVLEKEIARLEDGATQQSSKRILQTLSKQFSFLKTEYERIFPSLAKVCAEADSEIQTVCADIVYVSRLRYLHCSLCDSYVALGKEFSL